MTMQRLEDANGTTATETQGSNRQLRRRPDYLRAYPKTLTFGNIYAEDLVWLGDDLGLDPDRLLNGRGHEPEGALRLILGAIIDAHIVAKGPARAKRIDAAEKALLGIARKTGGCRFPLRSDPGFPLRTDPA